MALQVLLFLLLRLLALSVAAADEGHDSCIFPGSGGKNGPSLNGTSPAPSSNSTAAPASGSLSSPNSKKLQKIMILLSIMFVI